MPCGGKKIHTRRQYDAKKHVESDRSIGSSPYARIGGVRQGDAMRCGVFQLPFARKDATEHGHDILPRQRRADSDVVPRVRARLGIHAA